MAGLVRGEARPVRGDAGGPGTTSAAVYLEAEQEAILDLLRDWRVVIVDRADESTREDLLGCVLERLGRMEG